jgi:SET domain-containing protein
MMRLESLFIHTAEEKGRGVFTSADIAAGTVVEVAPVVVMPAADRLHLDQTLLHDYIFEWGDDRSSCAMALGWVPIYNHSYKSNCEYCMDFEAGTMKVQTIRPVQAGDELTVNYNGDWNDKTPLWFDAR